MRRTKIISLVLAAGMTMTAAVPVFASSGGADDTHRIVITTELNGNGVVTRSDGESITTDTYTSSAGASGLMEKAADKIASRSEARSDPSAAGEEKTEAAPSASPVPAEFQIYEAVDENGEAEVVENSSKADAEQTSWQEAQEDAAIEAAPNEAEEDAREEAFKDETAAENTAAEEAAADVVTEDTAAENVVTEGMEEEEAVTEDGAKEEAAEEDAVEDEDAAEEAVAKEDTAKSDPDTSVIENQPNSIIIIINNSQSEGKSAEGGDLSDRIKEYVEKRIEQYFTNLLTFEE